MMLYITQEVFVALEERIAVLENWILIVSVVGSFIIVLAGFLGWKTWGNIKNDVNTAVNARLEKIFDGKDALKNLEQIVLREKVARQLRVLFAAGDEKDALVSSDYNVTRRFFEQRGYQVSDRTVLLTADNVEDEIKGYDIVVFCVSENESDKKLPSSETPVYSYVVDHERPCILFAVSGIWLRPEILCKPHVSVVNYHAKLRETLYTLLYFSPLNRQ